MSTTTGIMRRGTKTVVGLITGSFLVVVLVSLNPKTPVAGHGSTSRTGLDINITTEAAFKQAEVIDHLTLKSGAIIDDKFNSLYAGKGGPNLLADVAFIEENAHFNRERIPERVVHAKGMASYGDFIVTNTKIAEFTKASVFSTVGKITPIAVRFSHVAGESGIADTARDVRGFAVKFYSETGIWDIVGNNLPVFFIRDPINFVSFIHSQKRHPKTHLKDPNAFWDFISLMPETMHATMMLFGDRGSPDGFRHMHGFGVNTFKLVNEAGKYFFAKFHWICDQGIKNLDEKAATATAGADPDYSLADLQMAISQKKYPSWTLKVQIMTPEQASQVKFDPFDVTKTWSHAQFPLIEVGKMTLNRNAENYFAQVEQLAFSPSNMIPGIEPSPDKMLVGRMFAYPDAQRYRLGANYQDLDCNKPRCPLMTPTYCDGQHSTRTNAWTKPNYVPNSEMLNVKADPRYALHPTPVEGKIGRYDVSAEYDNYSQAKDLVTRVMKSDEFARLCASIAAHMSGVTEDRIRRRALGHFKHISPNLASGVEKALKPL